MSARLRGSFLWLGPLVELFQYILQIVRREPFADSLSNSPGLERAPCVWVSGSFCVFCRTRFSLSVREKAYVCCGGLPIPGAALFV